LIRDIGIFLDLVNVIERLFEIPLLQKEFIHLILIVMKVLCVISTRGQKKTNCIIRVW